MDGQDAGEGWVLAHGLSSRQDLPLPFGYALGGALAAVLVSFLALGLLWKVSRLGGDAAGRPLPDGLAGVVDSAAFGWVLRGVGVLLVGFTAFAAVAGPDLPTNPSAGLVYVIFWVGLVPASLLFGPVWRSLNPLRTIHAGLVRLLGQDIQDPPFTIPAWLGSWPAAASLFSFVWLELCAPDSDGTATLRFYFAAYALVHVVAALCFGPTWFERCDGFEVYSSLIGRLSFFGRRPDGKLVIRNPLDNLDAVPVAPGLTAVVAVMLGSTAFDSITSTRWWATRTYDSPLSPTGLNTLALAGCVLFVAAAYAGAAWLAGFPVGKPARETVGAYAHSLIPIAVGYLIAHYFSLLVFAGQQTFINASDPLVNRADILGLADRTVDYEVVSVTAIAVLQVISIVTGHILGVFSAHDRSLRIFDRQHAVVGQIPMMALMIAYTFAGLSLLFAG
jgi:hypothetical protein